jgi:hypothetical protein
LVAKIRPVSWRVSVAGEEYAERVRKILASSGLECAAAAREPDLQEPPIFSFVATPKAGTTLTAPELKAILDQDDSVDTVFDI